MKRRKRIGLRSEEVYVQKLSGVILNSAEKLYFITLFPFPNKRLQELAQTTKKFVVVEVNMGQMVNDVRLAVNGKVPVELVHKGVGTPPAPEEIAAKVEGLL